MDSVWKSLVCRGSVYSQANRFRGMAVVGNYAASNLPRAALTITLRMCIDSASVQPAGQWHLGCATFEHSRSMTRQFYLQLDLAFSWITNAIN